MPDSDRTKVDWLVMLYLSGDNNLSSEMVWAINEIRDAGVPKGFGITIQYDALAPGVPTLRFRIDETTDRSGPSPGPFPFPEAVVERLADLDAASPEVLADFIRWSVAKFDAQRRMLILSGHGSGMIGDFLTDEQARRDRQPGSMTIRGIRNAVAYALSPPDEPETDEGGPRPSPSIREWGQLEGPVLHVLGMDSCLMSTLEVAMELATKCEGTELVKYLVASEGFVPNTGWPYGYLLQCLQGRIEAFPKGADARREALDPEHVCEFIVADCHEFYSTYLPAGVSFDIAACDVSMLETVAGGVRKLTSDIDLVERDQDDVVLAHWRSQSFKFEQYTDLYDFCSELKKAVNTRRDQTRRDKRLARRCAAVMTSIGHAVLKQERVGIEFQHSHGLSIYFPWNRAAFPDDEYRDAYGRLEFPKCSGWLDFLNNYLKETMRGERDKTGTQFPEKVDETTPPQLPQASRRKYSAGYNKFSAGYNKYSAGYNKYSAGYNKYSAGYNKYLSDMLGGRLPWSMKNPPDSVTIPPTARARPRRKVSASSKRATKVSARQGRRRTRRG